MATYYYRMQLSIGGTTTPDATQLQFLKQFVSLFAYKVTVTPLAGHSLNHKVEHSGKFSDTTLKSAEYSLVGNGFTLDEMNADFKITWEITCNGKHSKVFHSKFFESMSANASDWPALEIGLTQNYHQYKEGHIHQVVQNISQGVGWYLVKEPETFQNLVERIFITPSKVDWDVMLANNRHLGVATSKAGILRPGQVVIIATIQGDNHPQLKKMKLDAKKYQATWQKHASMNTLLSGISKEQSGLSKEHLIMMDIIEQGHEIKPMHPEPIDAENPILGYIDENKKYADGTLEFSKKMVEQTVKAHESIIQAANSELSKVTTVSGMTKRGTRAAAQGANKAFKILDGSQLARKIVKWNTGIQAAKASDYIRQEARVRHADYLKGIEGAEESMEKAGRYIPWLKKAGYVGIGIEATIGAKKTYEAAAKGHTKEAVSEGAQTVGSIGGGILVGAAAGVAVDIVIGVATGGVGLVVIGLFVAASAYAGSEGGKKLGEFVVDSILH